MQDELVATLVSWLSGVATTTALVTWDRRRLDAVGRSRMWHTSTLYLALSGLFLPAPLALGAHLWVTRPWPLWQRLPLALAGTALSIAAAICAAWVVLAALGQ